MPQENQMSSVGYQEPDVSHDNSPALPGVVSAMPPASVAEAMVYRGSTQWKASEGAYCALTLSTTANPLSVRRNAQRIFVDGPGTDDTVCMGSFYDYTTVYAPDVNGGTDKLHIIPDNCPPTQPAPWNTSGIYLTGLDENSTITVTAKLYFETAPYGSTNQLQSFAHPSAPYDPVALELYSRVMAHIPPGVKANMNATGDYWRIIANLIAAAAPVIGTVLSPLTGGLSAPIGAGIGMAAKMASGLIPNGAEKTDAVNRFVPVGKPVITLPPKKRPKARVVPIVVKRSTS
jgi:hypothetical protein